MNSSAVVLVAIVAFVLLGLTAIGVVAWLLLRPKKSPAVQPSPYGVPPNVHLAQPGYPAYPAHPGQPEAFLPYGTPVPDALHPAQPVAPPAPVQQFAPPSPVPAPPAPSAAPAPAPPAPTTAPQTWTAQVTEPGAAELDDSELDETTRLREDLRPAQPTAPPAPPADLTPPA